jgi:(1->4)-alpha-D-glucan 1-alpha-D-glucosylmutase
LRAGLVATYRWQLAPDNGFGAATEAVPDLAALGISHLYLSPIAEAVPGSTHGYDAVDPGRVRAELGGEDALRTLVEACHRHGMGVVVDVVPNHLAADPANPWWWDVLRLGRRSRWAAAFDVDWDPPKRELRERILLPVLGDHYGRELEAGNLRVARGSGDSRLLVIRYFDDEFPVSPTSTAALLAAAARRSGDDVLGVAARVLARVEDETIDLDARDADILVAERTARGRLADPNVGAALDAELADLHADVDRLDALLERQQHHRLAFWRVGHAELVYRRFFDVDTLVACRVEQPAVFEAVHRLPFRLLDEGLVDGLRIDHVDGLRDPADYVHRLRTGMPDDAWLVVEKILRAGEDLPERWAVDGTTGYEVADLLGAWLTEPAGGERLTALWRAAVGEDRSFHKVVDEARRLVLSTSLTADVARLTDAMVQVCEGRRRHRDHARDALRAALVEVAAHAPAYRSYVRFVDGDPEHPAASPADEAFVRVAVDAARASAPDIDPELLDLVEAVLLGRFRGECEAEVALRFQQLTGPVAAKGEEDTALYRWLPLPHRCEVGADPAVPTIDAATWHGACAAAQQRWPRRMTTLSTHDTKRSADVRARLAALTTMPDEVEAAWTAWWKEVGGDDPRAGWLVFHTLVGAHPLPLDRAWPAIEKSLREAKLSTSWTDVDDAYEADVRSVVERSLDDPTIGRHVAALAERVADAGRAAALAQLLLQLLAPGVPDVYQGSEGWDLSLVDPDNRRGIAPERRRDLLAAARSTTVLEAWSDDRTRAAGIPRAALVLAALGARRRRPAAALGAYVPLAADGPDAERVLAFGRGDPTELVVVAARPGAGGRVDAHATVALPDGTWIDVLGGGQVEGMLDLASRPLPIVLLEPR